MHIVVVTKGTFETYDFSGLLQTRPLIDKIEYSSGTYNLYKINASTPTGYELVGSFVESGFIVTIV